MTNEEKLQQAHKTEEREVCLELTNALIDAFNTWDLVSDTLWIRKRIDPDTYNGTADLAEAKLKKVDMAEVNRVFLPHGLNIKLPFNALLIVKSRSGNKMSFDIVFAIPYDGQENQGMPMRTVHTFDNVIASAPYKEDRQGKDIATLRIKR